LGHTVYMVQENLCSSVLSGPTCRKVEDVFVFCTVIWCLVC